MIRKRHILLDTCAGESDFNNSSLLYNVEHARTPMIVSGVNPKRKPLIIKKRGVSAFGNVYYSPDCAGNILSFGNAVLLMLSTSMTMIVTEYKMSAENISIDSHEMRL